MVGVDLLSHDTVPGDRDVEVGDGHASPEGIPRGILARRVQHRELNRGAETYRERVHRWGQGHSPRRLRPDDRGREQAHCPHHEDLG